MEKTKQTLYNFVSLRSPQSVKSDEKDFRFITVPDGETEPVGCMTFEGWEDFVNRGSGIDFQKESSAAQCYSDSDGNRDPRSFTGQAQYLVEHRSEIDYYHLMDLNSNGFRNISRSQVRRLFVELIKRLNVQTEFELKERIGDWLVLWNLLKNLVKLQKLVERERVVKVAEDAHQNKSSFGDAGSERESIRVAARPYIQQLLNATIVLPDEKLIVSEEEGEDVGVKIEENGPLKTNFTKNVARGTSLFVPSKDLIKKHEINLAAFRLSTSTLSEDEKRVLRSTILNNSNFTKSITYFAGSLVEMESILSVNGVTVSILENSAGTLDLILTPNSILESNKVPNTVVIKTKANIDYVNTLRNSVIKTFGNNWYIELTDIGNLKTEGGSIFIELTYANGHSYVTYIPVNKLLDGSGELISGSARPFKSRFDSSKEDRVPLKDKEGNDTEEFITVKEWTLELTEVVLPETGIADIEVILEDAWQRYVCPPVKQMVGRRMSIDLKDFPNNPGFSRDFSASVLITFQNRNTYFSLPYKIKFNIENPDLEAESFFLLSSGYDAYGKTYAPKGFGITQLGVADYQRVVSHVIRYEAAEVAHIENLMAGEYKERVVTKERITEVTDFESLETETEKLIDTTSAERFQMQTEIAQMQHEDSKTSLDARVSYNSGTGTSVDINYANSTATSREESNKQAITTARELTNRAMERIVWRVKTERTNKVTNRLTDVSKQGFDNRGSADHVSGVYRYVNAVYKNEIENYGRRLAYEFAVPEPSRLHRLGMQAGADSNPDIVELKKPIDPRTLVMEDEKTLFNWDQLGEDNYLQISREYDADVTTHPSAKTKVLNGELGSTSNTNIFESDIDVDKYYKIEQIRFFGTYNRWPHHDAGTVPSISYSILDLNGIFDPTPPKEKKDDLRFGLVLQPIRSIQLPGKVNVGINEINDCVFNICFDLAVSDEGEILWKKEVYKQILDAYEERLKEYKGKVAAIKQEARDSFETNPLNFRQIEQTILRMNCISYLIPQYKDPSYPNRNLGKEMYTPGVPSKEFETTRVDLSDSSGLDEYAAFVKFLEQAFEWNIMSYNFYPFYWGGEGSWKKLYQSDFNDPIFNSFMEAGMARVVVTVRPGFEFAVLLYMVTGKIWSNGHVPVYGDLNYVSMANELKDPPYTIADHWETVLPTELIALQRSGAIINTHGLPDFEQKQPDKYDDIDNNDAKFAPIIKNDEGLLAGKNGAGGHGKRAAK